MDYLFLHNESPFRVFEFIADYFAKNNLFEIPISLEKHYEILEKLFPDKEFSDCVRTDRLTNRKAKLSYENESEFKNRSFEFLKNEKNVEKYLPEYKGLPPRKIYTKLRFEKLFGGVYLYETKTNTLKEITEDFQSSVISFIRII